MDESRRNLLKGVLDPLTERSVVRAANVPAHCVVCVFARGAMDGLSLVAPYREANYYARRPNIAIPAPGSPEGALNLDGQFGLHPMLSALKPVFDAGDLAFVHAAGLASANRSHFDAQQRMEQGDAAELDGWLGRHLAATRRSGDSPFRAVAISTASPHSLAGPVLSVALPNFDAYSFPAPFLDVLASLYAGTDHVPDTGRMALAALDALAMAQPAARVPENGAAYPGGGFGQAMLRAAQLIKAGVGAEVICVDIGGWDTHAGQAASLANLCPELSGALAAFHTDLGTRMRDVTLVVMSEFGRTLGQNASLGTDHGWGGLMTVMGGGIRGGRVYADWPGLDEDALDRNGDLPATTDYRRVLYELLEQRLANPDPGGVFPGYRHAGDLGLF